MAGIGWLTNNRPERKRLFYFTAPSHAVENLQNKRIKISNFKKCNDLFELASVDLSRKDVRVEHEAWVKGIAEETGLICFTEDWRSTLMWGYYAQNGRGFCLVVDVDVTALCAVQYVTRRVELSPSERFPLPTDINFRQFSATKSVHWAHEKEQRYFVDLSNTGGEVFDLDGMKFFSFGASLDLVGIINGPRPDYGMNELLKAAGKSIHFFQSRPAFRDFHMVMQQSKGLWK